MLLSFRVSNHRSLRTEQQLLLTPSYPDEQPGDADWAAVPIAGIFGANASGKSNVLHALGYMCSLVRGSLRDSDSISGVSRHPFVLDGASRDEPSTYVADILINGVRYTYGFAVDDFRIVEEWLHTYPRRRKRVVFHRDGDKFEWGENTSPQLRKYADDLEQNVLFLSVAGRFKLADTQAAFEWFRKVRTNDLYPLPADLYVDRLIRRIDTLDLERITAVLRAADTGIDSVELIEESAEDWATRMERWKLRNDTGRASGRIPRRKFFQLRHRGEDGETFPLELRHESLGTQELMKLSVSAFGALTDGSVLLIDEIDRSLHPFLTSQVIGLFRNPETNALGAQLIFTSHDSALLGRIQGADVLHRDHIWFTEKNDCGDTELFPISAFRPRREDNRERRYLAGRYGAVPIVRDELFAAALSARDEDDDAE
ncbi:hypothetical protein B0T36_22975 [Nocardia donostiensis]|uniref:AAA family ATPase n=1 Tax=Nocardia donostiensis TaxID=1538463 RepID=UPI0009D9B160|nr:ATP-binding protein [Nocardia donostiensis]OQS12828.1 hypothetical protein B0T36_22975 [Nocardia donostiensis]